MAKKFVRGVTGVDDIEKLDKSLTNVNDLVSDGNNTYVHTKKGKTESYYNLTDNVKTIQSSGGTINVERDENGAVNLKTNPQIVMEHDNLIVSNGLTKEHTTNTTTINIDPREVVFHNFLTPGIGIKIYHLPQWYGSEISISDEFVGAVNGKQNQIENNTSIGVSGAGLQQLYALKQTYNVTGGLLKTHVKSVSQNTSVSTAEEEFNFIVKINQGVSSVNFTLNTHDTTKFSNIMSAYGSNNTVRISGCVFTLSGSTLTVSTTNNTNQNYVITFSDII